MEAVAFDGCFGWLHSPLAGARSDIGVVLCHGLSQDAATGHRPFRLLADALAAQGYPALRFDYPGTGDSHDVDGTADLDVWLGSIAGAIDRLRAAAGVRRVALVGLRFGAALAALAAEGRDEVAALVLLAPTLRGRPYVSQLTTEARLRAAGPVVPQDGIVLGELRLNAETLQRMSRIELSEVALPPGCPVAIYARAEGRSLTECTASWRAAGAEVKCFGFEALEALLRPTHLTDEANADVSGIVKWVEAAAARGPGAALSEGSAMPGQSLKLPGCTETALTFGPQQHLRGILCEPAGRHDRGPAVVIGNTGGNPHHGFARFSVEFARMLARHGIASFRIDFAGLGDSATVTDGGEGPTHVFEVDRAADFSAALNALEQRGYARFAAHGLCSGAYHAYHAGVADPRIETLLLVNLPWFTLRHEPPGPASFPRRSMRELAERPARTLMLFSAGDAGLRPLERHFGQAGLGLSGYPGVTVVGAPQPRPRADRARDAAGGCRAHDRLPPGGRATGRRPAAHPRPEAECLSFSTRPGEQQTMSIRATIIAQIRDVAQQQGKTLEPLTDDLPLLESGLDSLCIAIIVANLEDELGLDPLSSGDEKGFPVTLGDFMSLYENAAV